MRALRYRGLAVVIAFCIASQAQSAQKKNDGFSKEKLIGAWQLTRIEAPGPDGKISPITQPKGMLVYTRDGHVSVQLMYPDSGAILSNDYVLNGYEASFGTYDIDEAKHTVTHHVQGSVTHGLVGKVLQRRYQFTEDGHLIIKSTRQDEHWSVTWEHY